MIDLYDEVVIEIAELEAELRQLDEWMLLPEEVGRRWPGKKRRFQHLDKVVAERLGPEFKVCRRCIYPKPRVAFRPDDRMNDGVQSWCDRCLSEAKSESRKPYEPAEPSARDCVWCGIRFAVLGQGKYCSDECRVWGHRFRGYGLDRADFDRIWDEQKGRCGVCRCLLNLDEFHIDHDHDTEFVRGFLCPTCNTGLGLFRDSSVALRRAAVYLENHARSQQLSFLDE